MKKVWIIIQREYISRVRKKSFIIATLLAPLGFIALIVSSALISTYSSSIKRVAVVDESGLFVNTNFRDAQDGSIMFHLEKDAKSIERELKNEQSKYDAVIEIPANFDLNNPQKVTINYISEKGIGMMAQDFVNKTFSEEVRKLRAAQLHFDQAQLDDLNQEIKLDYIRLSDGNKKDSGAFIGAAIGYVLGFAIYITLLVYGTMIMKGVMEEKNNRIMEVLVSSVKPIQLMMAKIIGIGAVGLTQFFLWGVMLFLTQLLLLPTLGLTVSKTQNISQPITSNQSFDPEDFHALITHIQEINFWPILLVFIFFFIGGFLLYGSLFAAVGAAGGDETDSQSLTFPIMLPIVISVFILMNTLGQPEGSFAFWGSLIPFSSPLIMPALMPFGPPWWQVALSVVLLIAAFVLCCWVAAKIYRTGILMYGKKTSFREMMRWVFAKQ